MSEKEKKILETFGKLIPKLSDIDKERLLMFGEGMAFKVRSEELLGIESGGDARNGA